MDASLDMEMVRSNYSGDSSSERPAPGEEVGVRIVNAAENGAGEGIGVHGALGAEATFCGTVAGSASQQAYKLGEQSDLQADFKSISKCCAIASTSTSP
jgi:hypothetical protein